MRGDDESFKKFQKHVCNVKIDPHHKNQSYRVRPDEVEGPAKRSSAMAMEPPLPPRPPGKPEKAAAALIMDDGSANADEGRTCAWGREGGGGGPGPHL